MSIISIRKYARRILAPVIVVIVVSLTIGLFYIGLPSMNKSSKAYVGPSIKVNGEKISDADFNKYILQAMQRAGQYAQYGLTYSDSQIRDTAINLAAQDKTFEQEMRKVASKIKVTAADVDKLIQKYFPDETELQNFMTQQGFANKSDFKKAVAKDIQRQKFIAYKARQLKVPVSKTEVLEEMEQIKISHILISTKDPEGKQIRSDAEALKLVNEVYKKAISGGDFTKWAEKYSEDPGSKEKGGVYEMSLSQFKAQMDKTFSAAALALKEGQISRPVKTQFGYHIIKLLNRKMPKGKEYDAKYKEIEDNLLLQKVQQSEVFQKWVQQNFDKAQKSVEILDPGLKAFRFKQQQKWNEAAQCYEQAIKKAYYKERVDTYIDASDVYLKLKQPKAAITIMKKAPQDLTDKVEYQIALATAYRENKEEQQAEDILVKFGQEHQNDIVVHQKLKDLYTNWNLTDLVAKETKIMADIKKKEQEDLKRYQENIQQKTAADQKGNLSASPQPSPSKKK